MKKIKQFEKITIKKLKEFDDKIKTSFVLIRQDVDEMQKTIDAMREYLKKKDKEYIKTKERDNKIQNEFQRDVDEFTQKISQLKLALSAVQELKNEIVTKKDLAQIEDRIKTSFKNEIENYKTQVKNLGFDLKKFQRQIPAIKNGHAVKRRKWFSRKINS